MSPIVVDANVWVSSFRFGGVARLAVTSVRLNYQPVVCQDLINEVQNVLSTKFRIGSHYVDLAIADMVNGCLFVMPPVIEGPCRDPADNYLLSAADVAKAGMIVTGDKDLLVLARYKEIEIVTPRQFLDIHA